MIDFTSRRYPFTGFGDDPNSSIKFMMIRRGDDPDYGWEGGTPRLATHQILNSSDTITQTRGRDPYVMTVRLWFADRASLVALRAVQGAWATLRYNADMTDDIGGTVETRPHGRYRVLPETLLVSVDEVRVPRGQQPEAVATFQRAVGAASYYGFAVYAED
jgi:hypothetical protein